MPFTVNQTTNFFEVATQMGLSPVIRARLAQEGLEQIANFVDFKEEQLKDAFKNMRTAIPGIPATAEVQDNNGQVIQAAVAGVAAIPPVLVPANCSLRLRVASIAYHYYLSISREPTAANMNYALVLMSFYEEWEALLESIKNDPPEVPLLLKTTTPLKWMESFKECCYGTFGIRKTPVSYLLRDESNVPAEADDPLQQRRSFGLFSREKNFYHPSNPKNLSHDIPYHQQHKHTQKNSNSKRFIEI